MAIKRPLILVLSALALGFSGLLLHGLWQWHITVKYNEAIAQADYQSAAKLNAPSGTFAEAYHEQQAGNYQQARILYAALERTPDPDLRAAVLFNMGNTYLQQAASIDMATDADLASPLIELAKVSYRRLLALDSRHWDAKYNLERALQLQPDARDEALIELDGLRGGVRTVISPDSEDKLP